MTYPEIPPNKLKEILCYSDAIDLLEELGAIPENKTDEHTGFAVMPAEFKAKLVGMPFMILECGIKDGIGGTHYAEIILVTVNDIKAKIRDSSKGIYEQIIELLTERISAGNTKPALGIWVRKGLKYKDYPYSDLSTGTVSMSRTYYLDM